MTRAQWQAMADERAADANALIQADRWSCAYYVAGYAIECGLKASVLARIDRNSGVIFDDPAFEKIRIHKIDKLIKLADLQPNLDAETTANAAFAGYWGVVASWTEESRYQTKTEIQAREIYEAITNNTDGVLRWIRNHW